MCLANSFIFFQLLLLGLCLTLIRCSLINLNTIENEIVKRNLDQVSNEVEPVSRLEKSEDSMVKGGSDDTGDDTEITEDNKGK